MKKPKKYLLNPEWVESQKEKHFDSICLWEGTAGAMQVYPQRFGRRVPEEGAWILVIDPPSGTPITIEPLSVYYAIPEDYLSSTPPRHRVNILTREGMLYLWPHEYIIVST
jgi:hypothetical protein